MEALTSSFSTKIFTRNSNKTLSPSSTFTLLGRSYIGFSRSPIFKKLQFHDLVLSRTVAKSHVASDATEASIGLEDARTGFPNIKTSKTIHVKFQLQKQCMFGEQFLLLGDDPMLGLWNPADAIPMNWSDGHVWSAELDLPIDSTIQFKFILKQSSGEILWQPGPDRIFKCWESKATILISEDWENSEAQKIIEEAEINADLDPIVAGDISNQTVLNKDLMFSGNIAYAGQEKLEVDNEHMSRGSILKPKKNNSRSLAVDGDEETLFSYEEGNVLVPGTTPLQGVSTEKALTNDHFDHFDHC